jgi:hypothetical protein
MGRGGSVGDPAGDPRSTIDGIAAVDPFVVPPVVGHAGSGPERDRIERSFSSTSAAPVLLPVVISCSCAVLPAASASVIVIRSRRIADSCGHHLYSGGADIAQR